MKTFKDKVRWNFRISMRGYGRNVKEALSDAVAQLDFDVDCSFSRVDFEAIENHELISIDEESK